MKNSKRLSKTAAAAFIVSALTHLIGNLGMLLYGVTPMGLLPSLLPILFYVMIAVVLFQNKNSYVLTAACVLMSIYTFYSVIVGFSHVYDFLSVLYPLMNLAITPIWILLAFVSFENVRQEAHPTSKSSKTKYTLLNVGLIIAAFFAAITVSTSVSNIFEIIEYMGFSYILRLFTSIVSNATYIVSLLFFKNWLNSKREENEAAAIAAESFAAASNNFEEFSEDFGKGIVNEAENYNSSQAYTATSSEKDAQRAKEKSEYFISIGIHICLLLITGGIWQLIWIYKATKYSNLVENERQRDPIVSLLLYMFVPFYSIYWTYAIAERIDKIARSRGVQSDIATICVVLSIFIGILPPILMQDKMNKIITEGDIYQDENEKIAKEIDRYRVMLNQGLITEEEFEAKRRQLLGL